YIIKVIKARSTIKVIFYNYTTKKASINLLISIYYNSPRYNNIFTKLKSIILLIIVEFIRFLINRKSTLNSIIIRIPFILIILINYYYIYLKYIKYLVDFTFIKFTKANLVNTLLSIIISFKLNISKKVIILLLYKTYLLFFILIIKILNVFKVLVVLAIVNRLPYVFFYRIEGRKKSTNPTIGGKGV
ncbi:hypothetical protein LZ32DRAFT_616022, partial [Colletotrichum eremochloae]